MTTQINGDTGVSQCQPNSVSQDDLQSGVVGKGPAFRVAAGITTAPDSVYTVPTWTTKDFDTSNAFNMSTGRFQPTVAGYYQFNAIVVGGGAATSNQTSSQIVKIPVFYPQ